MPPHSPTVTSYVDQLFLARRPPTDSSSIRVADSIMPRPNPPPTPGSSSDLRGKEGSVIAPAFNLPPTALPDHDRASMSSSTSSANGSDSSYRPASPTSPATLSRKRPQTQSGSVITRDDFTLPPPPTRSRKIIQMKPRENELQPTMSQSNAAVSQATKKPATTSQGGVGKRKQNNAGTTAAGRKIARKTAHSLIERRRRSKMNEEFGVLKDMIPACKGQEMHKLAILQASIEYLRYLEQCVTDLQAQNRSPHPQAPPIARVHDELVDEDHEIDDGDDDEDDDEEMQDSSTTNAHANTGSATPATAALEPTSSVISLPSLSQITTTSTTSPSVFSPGADMRHYSISSASQASYSPYFHSTQASPAFGPQLHHLSVAGGGGVHFGLGSPALKPMDSNFRQINEAAGEVNDRQKQQQQQQRSNIGRSEQELDQEATAALLMLNHDRRNWRGTTSAAPTAERGNGMSVRDLLTG